MALNPKLATAARNRFLDQLNTDIGASGFLRFYTGTQPTTANTALGAQVQLASLPLSATAFGAASAGTATAGAITGVTAVAAGTATWASFVTSAGVRVLDVEVGTSGADINFNTVVWSIGTNVAVTAYTLSIAA